MGRCSRSGKKIVKSRFRFRCGFLRRISILITKENWNQNLEMHLSPSYYRVSYLEYVYHDLLILKLPIWSGLGKV